MSTSSTPTPAADFPVVWDDPRDAKITWMVSDRPKAPILPLSHAFVAAFFVGNGAGFARAGVPLSIRVARLNTYQYVGMVPTGAPPEAMLKAMGLLNRTAPGAFRLMMGKMAAGMSKKQLDALSPIVERFEAYWNDELLPEIKQHIAYFESCDLRGLSLDQLRAHLAEALRRVGRPSGLLRPLLMPLLFSISQIEELYRASF